VQRSETRFLTTHTGSLIRPDAVVGEPASDAFPDRRTAHERALTPALTPSRPPTPGTSGNGR
jgi:hypothetical protein